MMNRKAYIQPSVKCVKITTAHMTATSVGFGEGTKNGSDAAARGSFLWDDEDEY